MITTDREFYSSPYYFFLRDKGKDYSLYFSVEETLSEARKKDEMIKVPKDKVKHVKAYLEKLLKNKKKKSTKEISGELEELVNLDGAMSNSKIPILDPKLHPKKTMDQTVAAARITNDPISRGYRTYYGESVEEEMTEIDMSGAFGYEETEDMDGKETYDYMVKKLDMDPEEAKDRTEQQGKDPSGKKDKKSKYYKDKNFITRATLSEIQKMKAIKMVEDLLTKKSTDNSEVGRKVNADNVEELPLLIRKNLKSLMRQVEKHGFSKEDIIKLIKKSE
jgi:hypothetical protein